MRVVIILFFVLLSAGFAQGQELIYSDAHPASAKRYVPYKVQQARPRSLYLELAGSGGFGSFNYEWNFANSNKLRWMFRTGISGTYIDKNNGVGFIFPVMIHGVLGNKHGLDVGLGQTLTVTTKGSLFLRTPLSIGYRLEPEGKRIFYRFSYTPIISYLVDFQWEHWGGISIGYKLKSRPKLIRR